jgi:hypothetical protein
METLPTAAEEEVVLRRMTEGFFVGALFEFGFVSVFVVEGWLLGLERERARVWLFQEFGDVFERFLPGGVCSRTSTR